MNQTFLLIRKTLNALLYGIDTVLKRQNTLFVLCYHSIENDSWRFSISPAMLKKQIRFLKKAGFTFISLDQLVDHVVSHTAIPKKAVVVTIDDGYKNVIECVSFFEEEGIKPALFVLSSPDQANRKELANTKAFLPSNQIQALIKKGWTIGSHSATHANLTLLNEKELQREVVDSKTQLEKTLKTHIHYFAYPRGKYDKNVETVAKKSGYKGILTMDDGLITSKTNVYNIPRIGVDGTHGILEFQTIFSPSVIGFRKAVKESFLGGYL